MYVGKTLGGGNVTGAGFVGFLAIFSEDDSPALDELLFLFLEEDSVPNNVFAAVLVALTSKPSLNA